MAIVVFFCIPAHGHTNPTLGVVRELIARGHEVRYYSYNIMREKIEATGATFVSCDEYDCEQRLEPKEAARIGKDPALSIRVLVDTTLALDDHICADMERLQPDCIVADSMAVWGKAAALKLGIPFISSTTTFAFNQHSAKVMKQSPAGLLKMLISMPRINRDINRLQAKGYPIKSVLDIIQNDDQTNTIVYTSPEFQPCSDTFSARYAFVGPSIRPVSRPVEKTKPVLVYISMGTVNNDMLPLYRQCIDALRDTDYQVIISAGTTVKLEAPENLPAHIAVYPQVDQIAVLEQADIFITHCGMNSVSEALYYGVPLVMLPQTAEQCGVAERVGQLGAGLRVKKPTVQTLKSAVHTVLQAPQYRAAARRIQRDLHRCGGAKQAADRIETVIAEK